MYKILLVSPDGKDYVQDCKGSESVEQAWEWCEDLGSKWFFYPLCFVIKDNCSTVNTSQRIIDSPEGFEHLTGRSIKNAMQDIANDQEYVTALLS